MFQSSPPPGHLPANNPHGVNWSIWAPIFMFISVQIGGLVYFVSATQQSSSSLERTLDKLSATVERLGSETNRLTANNERLDEHVKLLDKRIDRVEDKDSGRLKDEWKRQ